MSIESAIPSSLGSQVGIPPSLVFTDAAAAKVSELIREEANPNLKLRVFVQGGGCSGFQYGFTFDENLEEGDIRDTARVAEVIKAHGVDAVLHLASNPLRAKHAKRHSSSLRFRRR